MKKYCLKHLPHWVITNLQPAFYDSESLTAVQQTARVYAKMQELITLYNEFTDQVNKYITEFENGIIKDFNEFQNCVLKTLSDYIKSIDTKIELQDSHIEEEFNRQDEHIEEKFTEQDAHIEEKFAEQDEVIADAVNYMKTNLVSTLGTLFTEALESGNIEAILHSEYDPIDESLVFSIIAESTEDNEETTEEVENNEESEEGEE